MTKLYEIVSLQQQEVLKSKTETKKEGLEHRCRKRLSMVDYVLQIESLWGKYAYERTEHALERLIRHLSPILKMKAHSLGNRWNNSKLSAADFESVFYETTWQLCDKYNHYGEFYFYETLLLSLERRAIDLTRAHTKTKRGAFEVDIRRLKEEAAEYLADESIDVEGSVLEGLLVTQLLNDVTLTIQERQLLQAKYEYPNASMTELAKAARLKHHEEVRRSFKRIGKKMAHYIN
ncbi:hypothetical protein [Metabacillus malikii]|uniref:Sigma-70 family RNA polymerase sigma factor n=1 Tax=Metabacillus malikii TaxID=1504265 RepID=A0ABT9ZNC7_9BACI|nr:hypothetical protein [Metabacillus malikii]MDQ0233028.1 hypothetical protein [Metabacillus malikii]